VSGHVSGFGGIGDPSRGDRREGAAERLGRDVAESRGERGVYHGLLEIPLMRGTSRARHRENEVLGSSASFREFGSEAAREFRFERGEDQPRVRLTVVFPRHEVGGSVARPAAHLSADVEFEFHEIDVLPAERERFGESHPGEGEDRDSDRYVSSA
jgi:hypothetical protein